MEKIKSCLLALALMIFTGQLAAAGGGDQQSGSATSIDARYQQAKRLYEAGNHVQSLRQFEALARQGYLPAMMSAAYQHEVGQGVPQDIHAALRWYRKAASGGMAAAYVKLALLYQEGRRVPRNLVLANALYQVARSLNPGEPAAVLVKLTGEMLTDEQKKLATRLVNKMLAEPWRAGQIIARSANIGAPVTQ